MTAAYNRGAAAPRAPRHRRPAMYTIRPLLVLLAMAGVVSACAPVRPKEPAPVLQFHGPGTPRAWWPSQVTAAVRFLGYPVVFPASIVRRVAHVAPKQVIVVAHGRRRGSIDFVFGTFSYVHTQKHRWVIVAELAQPTPSPVPGRVTGTGTHAWVYTDGLNIDVTCDQRTNNALRLVQLIAQRGATNG